ncbi:DUF6326 family protein [Rhodanobacter ginsengiterrae]|uniref:DUF6326 family protein n=1 Tax=Rhodanobacter ginsengiterrae TaxID=2008451 RepID=UPI003CEF82D1
MKHAALSDIKVHTRFRLSGLWTALMFCYIYGDYFGLYVPGKLQGMLAGTGPVGPVSEASLVATALLLAVPGVMVFLSLVLWPQLCRWLNIGLGVFYTVIMLLTMPGAWWFYITLGVIEVVLSLLIVVQAWRWPKS